MCSSLQDELKDVDSIQLSHSVKSQMRIRGYFESISYDEATKKQKRVELSALFRSAPVGTRTQNQTIKSRLLCQIELQERLIMHNYLHLTSRLQAGFPFLSYYSLTKRVPSGNFGKTSRALTEHDSQ